MRPLKLVMTAFGPYKDQEVIDFSELQEHRLFVVSGNTGAGKTSIFDAICFALYGEASGEDRYDSRMLRSHFTDDSVYTSVDFSFELKGREYRVFRQLAHVKAGNKNATGDRHELYAIVGGQEVPLTDRFIVSQVDQKIREIIGLDKDQFSQIVMLPQGEFRKLLTSETDNKEEILRRIFKTNLYKYVADQLNEKRKQMERICKERSSIRDYHIGNAKGSLGGREGSELNKVFGQEHYNTYQVIEALNGEIEYYAGEIEKQGELLQAENTQFQEKTAIFHQAKNVNAQFDLVDQKEVQRTQLENREEEYKQKAQQLSLAEQAVHLQAYERQAKDMTEEFSRKRKLLDDALSELSQAKEAFDIAVKQYEQEEAKGEHREQTMVELARLEGLLPTVQEIERKREQVLSMEAETALLIKQLQAVESEFVTKQTERDTIAAQVKQLEGDVIHLPDWTEKLNLLREQALIVKDYTAFVRRAEGEEEAARKHKEAFEQVEMSYSILENRWIEGQAGILSSHLHDGGACPVCGSHDHPNKAVLKENVPNKEELDRKRNEKSELEKKYLEANATLDATLQQVQEKARQVLEFGFTLDGIEDQYQDLSTAGKALAEEVKRLKEDHAKLVQLKQSLDTLDSQVVDVRKQKEDLTGRSNDKWTAYATEKALYDQALAAIPEDLREIKQLEQQIRTKDQLKKQLDVAWKNAQQQYKACNERNVKAMADRDNAENQKRDAQANMERARLDIAEELKKAGFETEEAYHAAKMSDSSRTELKKQIEDYHTSLTTICKQIEELKAALVGEERQDLVDLKRQLDELEQHIESIRSRHIRAKNDYSKGLECKENIIIAEQNWKEAEQEQQLVKDLFDVVRGENSKKISFERYLQIEFLEKIIHAANQRLRQLSNGQYYLVRSDRLEKRGKQSGLGFDIYDNYTGQLRDVKTLSGGEKFNASLCLALGMSDVIQSYEGGISLETMFIDEGFGSLDEEALNKAIDTLVDLQQSGRMIGVISHVQELKQAIPAILEVKKTREGHSYTKFVVN